MTSAVHCLHCGYNLTGLPENRCPECGQSFATEEVQAIKDRFRPSIGRTLGKILLVPMLFTLLGLGMGLANKNTVIPWLTAAGIVFLLYGIIQSIMLAKRFAWQRAIRTQGKRPINQAAPFIIATVTGLVCCQAFLSAAGFFGGCALGYFNRYNR